MKDKVSIDGVKINIGDVKLELTVKQAKGLYELLDELVGDKRSPVATWPVYIPTYYPRPYYYGDWYVTWGGVTSGATTGGGNSCVTYTWGAGLDESAKA